MTHNMLLDYPKSLLKIIVYVKYSFTIIMLLDIDSTHCNLPISLILRLFKMAEKKSLDSTVCACTN